MTHPWRPSKATLRGPTHVQSKTPPTREDQVCQTGGIHTRAVCSAICPDLSTEAVTLADIQAARGARWRQLRQDIKGHATRLADLLREGAVVPAGGMGFRTP